MATKTVNIIAKYIHKTDGKPNGTVTYLVRASNGIDTYCTTIIDGEASGCSCPSRSKNGCYHRVQLQAKEQESRKSVHEAVLCEDIVASRYAASNLPAWVGAMVAKGVLKVPALPIAQSLPAELKGSGKTATVGKPGSADLAYKGNLNGQRGFSVLKIA